MASKNNSLPHRWEETRKARADTVRALEDLATRARDHLASPTPELMKQVFDLLDLRVLVTIDGLELSGTVPIGDWDDDEAAVGELRSGVPQRLCSNLTGAVALHFVHVDDWVPQRIVTATRQSSREPTM